MTSEALISNSRLAGGGDASRVGQSGCALPTSRGEGAARFVADSPLEEAGFELTVPP